MLQKKSQARHYVKRKCCNIKLNINIKSYTTQSHSRYRRSDSVPTCVKSVLMYILLQEYAEGSSQQEIIPWYSSLVQQLPSLQVSFVKMPEDMTFKLYHHIFDIPPILKLHSMCVCHFCTLSHFHCAEQTWNIGSVHTLQPSSSSSSAFSPYRSVAAVSLRERRWVDVPVATFPEGLEMRSGDSWVGTVLHTLHCRQRWMSQKSPNMNWNLPFGSSAATGPNSFPRTHSAISRVHFKHNAVYLEITLVFMVLNFPSTKMLSSRERGCETAVTGTAVLHRIVLLQPWLFVSFFLL